MTTLKVLGLIDANGHPAPVLEELVFAEGERRREVIRSVLRAYYTPVFQLDLARATRGQFHEVFRSFGAREGVLAKCEAFFIQAANDAGIDLSQYIMSGRHLSRRRSSPGRQRPPSAERPSASTDAAGAAVLAPEQAERVSQVSTRLTIAEMILSKYPDFDPAWQPEVQARWLDGMTKLYEGLAASDNAVPEG